jgi:hypothetical protein
MTFDSAFEEFMPETVSIRPFVSETSGRVRTYGTAITVRCRIEQYAKLVRAADGTQVVSDTRLFCKPTTEAGATWAPTIRDEVTLPAGYTPQIPPIVSIERDNDETQGAAHHFVLSF